MCTDVWAFPIRGEVTQGVLDLQEDRQEAPTMVRLIAALKAYARY